MEQKGTTNMMWEELENTKDLGTAIAFCNIGREFIPYENTAHIEKKSKKMMIYTK
jgi:hypothetical protein